MGIVGIVEVPETPKFIGPKPMNRSLRPSKQASEVLFEVSSDCNIYCLVIDIATQRRNELHRPLLLFNGNISAGDEKRPPASRQSISQSARKRMIYQFTADAKRWLAPLGSSASGLFNFCSKWCCNHRRAHHVSCTQSNRNIAEGRKRRKCGRGRGWERAMEIVAHH